MKRRLLMITTLICSVLLTGCWDRIELNDRGLILALGIDRDAATGDIILINQVVKPQSLKEQETASTSHVEIVVAKGKSVYDSRKDFVKKFDRRPFYSHSKILVISEGLAAEGIQPILDRLVRSNEPRPLEWIIIAKGTSPEEIFNINQGASDLQAAYLEDIIDQRKSHSEAHVSNLKQFIANYLGGITSPTAGVMEVKTKESSPSAGSKGSAEKEIKLAGTAVFNKDKLIGYLTDKETKSMNIITGKLKSGDILFSSPNEEGKMITTNIKKLKSSIKPEKKDEKFVFNINIKITTELADQQDISDISQPKTLKLFEKKQEEALKKEIKDLIDKLQDDLHADVLGFGSTLSKEYPKDWKKIKAKWDKKFSDASYTVNIDSTIVRTGLLNKPLKIPK